MPGRRDVEAWRELRINTTAENAYDTLVRDSRYGFWLTLQEDGALISRIGVGEPVSDAPGHVTRSAYAENASYVGWIGYESAASVWLRARNYVSIEHATGRVRVHAPESAIDSWAARVSAELERTAGRHPDQTRETVPHDLEAQARHTPVEYRRMIASALDSIRAGDAYQLCLTTRFTVPGLFDPRTVHAQLTRADAPYSALIRSGDTALAAASPEQFLRLTASGRLSTSPIKGTRPRAHDSASSDARLARELAADAKERAENLMIVDLMRNDLSRVCIPESVRVVRLFDVEHHAHVHQLVSEVCGRLDPGRSTREVIDAVFPAGSMTGAPKQRAMQILADLEGQPRGAYSGCFGWLAADGSMNLAMTIRSVVIGADEATVGAGGGLTIDSRPDFEVDEVVVKARAPLAALGARIPAEWEVR